MPPRWVLFLSSFGQSDLNHLLWQKSFVDKILNRPSGSPPRKDESEEKEATTENVEEETTKKKKRRKKKDRTTTTTTPATTTKKETTSTTEETEVNIVWMLLNAKDNLRLTARSQDEDDEDSEDDEDETSNTSMSTPSISLMMAAVYVLTLTNLSHHVQLAPF